MIEKIDTGACTALVDAVVGAGVMMRRDIEDIRLPGLPVELPDGLIGYGSGSLVAESWNTMIGRLSDGWVFTEDEEGELMVLASTPDGAGTAYALSPRAEIGSNEPYSIDEHDEWVRMLLALLETTGEPWVLADGWLTA